MELSYSNYTMGSPWSGNISNLSEGGEPACPGIMYLVTVEILVALVGFPANIRVLLVLWRVEIDAATTNLFTGSLAVLDGVNCLTIILHVCNTLLSGHFEEIFSTLLFLLAIYEMGGALFLCCVCADRYAAVLHPILFTRYRHPRYRTTVAALVWLQTLGYGTFIAFSNFEHNDCIFIAFFLATFLFISYCNLALLLALRRSSPGDSQSGASNSKPHPVKQRAFRMVLGIHVVVLVCFLPAAAVFPYEHMIQPAVFECYVSPLFYSLIVARGALQPLLFLFQAGKLPCMAGTGHSLEICCC